MPSSASLNLEVAVSARGLGRRQDGVRCVGGEIIACSVLLVMPDDTFPQYATGAHFPGITNENIENQQAQFFPIASCSSLGLPRCVAKVVALSLGQ